MLFQRLFTQENLGTSSSGAYLKLDQTTPQTVINGAPIFDQGANANERFLVTYDGISGFCQRDTATNYSQIGMGVVGGFGGYTYIQSNKSGSGTLQPLQFWIGTSPAWTIDNGTLGLFAGADGTAAYNIITNGGVTAGTINDLTLIRDTVGFYISGGVTSKTLTVSDDADVSGTNTGDQVGDGVTITGAGTVADPFVSSAGANDKVKYDAGDPTAGYVADKFVAGTGITLAEGTGADENKLKITNSSPDQTVSLSEGSGISISGTYPDFTITNDDTGSGAVASHLLAYDHDLIATALQAETDPLSIHLDQTTPQTIGDTTNRLAKLWATDITCTNAISGSVTGNAGTVTNGIYTTSQVTALAATDAGDRGKYLKSNSSTGVLEWATVAGGGDMVLADVQSVTGLKTFDKDKLAMKGTSTGVTTISTANTSATSYTATLQAGDGTLAYLTDIPSITGLATKALDNLTGVAINTSLISDTDSTYDLGSSSKYWANAYIDKIITTGDIELGHASDTTISRVSAGVIAVEGVTVPTISSTSTLSNKRNQKRTYSTTSSATLTPEIDTYDCFVLTAQAADLNIANHSTSTPIDNEMIMIEIQSDATPRLLSFGTNYVAKCGISLPTTTVASKRTTLLFKWCADLTKWNLMSLGQES